MAKKTKSIVESLILYELHSIDDIRKALLSLKLIDNKYGYPTESDVWCWFEADPSEAEQLKVLKKIGYDVSVLQAQK